MFRGSAQSLNFEPSDGMKVLARGRVCMRRAVRISFYIEEMIPDGVGELYIAYEQLKKQLEEEGLSVQNIKSLFRNSPKRSRVIYSLNRCGGKGYYKCYNKTLSYG